jgi:hypothetical protein
MINATKLTTTAMTMLIQLHQPIYYNVLIEMVRTINILKYLMYQHHQQKLRLQNEYFSADVDELLDNAIAGYVNENEETNNNQRRTPNQQPTNNRRTTFRRGINRIRNPDGLIVIITPKMSSWYITYVVDPRLECNKFVDKFRRRFRCSYQSFQILLTQVKESYGFNRWHNTLDTIGRECSPIELLLLGTLRYLGQGWNFEDLEEATSISEEIHRVFFHIYIKWGKTKLFPKYVTMPTTINDIRTHVGEFEEAGLHGCIGSVDATHIGMLRCPYSRWHQHKGPKESCPARTYNIIVNHRRQILSSTSGHPSRWNDKTLTLFDTVMLKIIDY